MLLMKLGGLIKKYVDKKCKFIVRKIFIRRDPMKLKIKSYKLFLLIFLVPFTSLGQSIGSNIEQTISLGDLFSQGGGWAMWPLGLFSFLLVFLIIKKFIIIKRKGLLKPKIYIHRFMIVSRMAISLRLKIYVKMNH